MPERDQHAGDRDRDQADDEDARLGGEPGRAARIAERRPERLEELDRQDVAVDRRPQPEDEPPAGRGHHEADAAAQDPGLPDVVAAGPRDRHDQPAVGDDQERHQDCRDEDRGDELALGERGASKGELVDSQRDEVRRQARIDDRVPDRPAADQAGGVTQEQGRGSANGFCRHFRLSVRGGQRG